jgi:signal transduction histidine kinase/ligand-binding sensor domain-containing protein
VNSRLHYALVLQLVLLLPAVLGGQSPAKEQKRFAPQMMPVVAHIKWTGRDGAPGNVAALAQTTDGYLWLGTPLGLYRFDGLQFASYPMTSLDAKLPASDIDALTSDMDGGLWIGFRLGGISHLTRDGTLTNYNATNRRGPKSVLKMVTEQDKSVWAVADNKILVLRGDHWEDFGSEHGLLGERLASFYLDSHGNIWTSGRHKLFVLYRGHASFEVYPTETFLIVEFAELPNGQMWISDGWRTIRTLNPGPPTRETRVTGYTRMLAEPSGTVWLAQDYRGVSHFQPESSSETPNPTEEKDLSSEQTNSILRDRDGDIWVGTSRGLDRFQASPLKAVRNTRVEYYPALAADVQSGVWIGMLAHPLVHALGDKLLAVGRQVGSSPMVCDDQGRVWLVDPISDSLTEYDRGNVSRIPAPKEVHRVPAQSIGLDYDGAVLVSFDEFGLWRFDGKWEQVNDPNLPAAHPLAVFRDRDRRVWLGYPDGYIMMRDQYGVHAFTRQQSANLGNVLTFAVAHDRVWAAGANGLAYFDHGVFRPVFLRNDGVLRGISGIVEDRSGGLWLNTSTGILRIRPPELNRLSSSADPSPLDFDLLDDRQGVEGTATQIKPTPSAVADRNGLLWFSMSGAVYSVDPDALSLRKSVAALSLQKVSINGASIMDREHTSTIVRTGAAGLKELEIDYIGIDLSSPEKVTYQYMLEGEEKAWHEVGNRRQAFYSRLRPGTYRFRVRAWNGTMPWQELSAPLVVVITPAFYQTIWFYLLSALVILTLLYLLYLLRVRYLTNRLKERLKGRLDERLRIARALHDTLLQSLHGLMLQFHVAALGLPDSAPARQSLELALVRADAVCLETRGQVQALRDVVAEGTSLVNLIEKRVEEMDIRQSMTFQIVEKGRRQPLNTVAQVELYGIASEALNNTILHAKAPSAKVELTYGGSSLLMKCCDSGVGLPTSVLASGQRTGHWGLIGIRERAEAIGGKLQIRSSPGGGTEIEVCIPGRTAYLYPGKRLIWLQRFLHFRRSATGLDSEPEMEA